MPSRDAGATEVFRPRVLGWSAGLLLTPLLVGAFLLLAPRPPTPRWLGAAVIALDLLLTGILIGRRGRNGIELSPRGLRVTHDAGVDQLDWPAIRSAERVEDERLILATRDGGRIIIELDAYRDVDRAAIWRRVRGYSFGNF